MDRIEFKECVKDIMSPYLASRFIWFDEYGEMANIRTQCYFRNSPSHDKVIKREEERGNIVIVEQSNEGRVIELSGRARDFFNFLVF